MFRTIFKTECLFFLLLSVRIRLEQIKLQLEQINKNWDVKPTVVHARINTPALHVHILVHPISTDYL